MMRTDLPIRRFAILAILLVSCSTMSGQTTDTLDASESVQPEKVERSIALYLLAGATTRIFPSDVGSEGLDYKSGGLAALIRLAIVPEHMLRLGFETGLFRASTVNEVPGQNTAPRRVLLTAIPAFITAGIGNDRFEIGGGVGVYELVVTAGEEKKIEFTSTGSELGYMVNAAYFFPLNGRLSLGADARVFQFTDRPITMAMLCVALRGNIFKFKGDEE